MSDISPVQGFQAERLEPIADRHGPRPAGSAPRPERPSDRVELSDRARYLSKLAALPDVRSELVERVRREIAAGSYETDERLDGAVSHLLDELEAKP
jgi:negative regulator of flagellin synthesis FlgM